MDIERRVAQLERQARVWRTTTALCACTMACLVLTGQAGPLYRQEVRAQRFVLIGQDGKEAGWLGFEGQTPDPMLSLTSPHGNQSATLVAADSGATLMLADNGSKASAFVGSRHGTSAASMLDAQGRIRVHLDTKDNFGSVMAFGPDSKSGAGLIAAPDGQQRVAVYDQNTVARVMLDLTKDGQEIGMFDPAGKPLWTTAKR